jgi:alpha-L-rhamnosidase
VSALRATRLTCEHLVDPVAVEAGAPRLAWVLSASRAGELQTAYRVEVADSLGALAAGELRWDSGRVASGRTLGVAYGGTPLAPGAACVWRVTVWDSAGVCGPPSEVAAWGRALAPGDWVASWVGHGHAWAPALPPSGEADPLHAAGMSSALLRGRFVVDRPVVRAVVHATARGVYRLALNGARVGDDELAPGWTDYRRRIHVQSWDVTGLLRDGENAVGVELSEGWYAGFVGWSLKRRGAHYGSRASVLVQLRLEHADGTVTMVASGPDWRTSAGGREYGDLLMGERVDLRAVPMGWALPGFDASGWSAAVEHAPPAARLLAQPCEPVRVTQRRAPVARTQVAADKWIYDFGQNLVGRVALDAVGEVVVRHGEALAADGSLYVENLRGAVARDSFVADAPARFEPAFTFHGFRYAEVRAPVVPERVEAAVLHSDAPWAGSLQVGHPGVQRLVENAAWSQRGNFLAVPTDCPQRDERLGWLADAQVFAATACLNMRLPAFFAKWLDDVFDAQAPDGAFPDVAPLLPGLDELAHGAPGWGDGGVLVPWLVYRAYGDERVLERALPAIERWLAHLDARNPDGRRRHARYNDYGDWLELGAATPKELLGSAYWAWSALTAQRIAAAWPRRSPPTTCARTGRCARRPRRDISWRCGPRSCRSRCARPRHAIWPIRSSPTAAA